MLSVIFTKMFDIIHRGVVVVVVVVVVSVVGDALVVDVVSCC